MIELQYGYIPYNPAGGHGKPPQKPNDRGGYTGHLNPELVINFAVDGRTLKAETVGGRTISIYQVKSEADLEDGDPTLYEVKDDLLKKLSAFGTIEPVSTAVSSSESETHVEAVSAAPEAEEPAEEQETPPVKKKRAPRRRTTRTPRKKK